ncbi:hypothetical protein BGZ94_003708 [Podila epigama]|nr:hypothetical protein BGZ94_003708 [Podila epigama]
MKNQQDATTHLGAPSQYHSFVHVEDPDHDEMSHQKQLPDKGIDWPMFSTEHTSAHSPETVVNIVDESFQPLDADISQSYSSLNNPDRHQGHHEEGEGKGEMVQRDGSIVGNAPNQQGSQESVPGAVDKGLVTAQNTNQKKQVPILARMSSLQSSRRPSRANNLFQGIRRMSASIRRKNGHTDGDRGSNHEQPGHKETLSTVYEYPYDPRVNDDDLQHGNDPCVPESVNNGSASNTTFNNKAKDKVVSTPFSTDSTDSLTTMSTDHRPRRRATLSIPNCRPRDIPFYGFENLDISSVQYKHHLDAQHVMNKHGSIEQLSSVSDGYQADEHHKIHQATPCDTVVEDILQGHREHVQTSAHKDEESDESQTITVVHPGQADERCDAKQDSNMPLTSPVRHKVSIAPELGPETEPEQDQIENDNVPPTPYYVGPMAEEATSSSDASTSEPMSSNPPGRAVVLPSDCDFAQDSMEASLQGSTMEGDVPQQHQQQQQDGRDMERRQWFGGARWKRWGFVLFTFLVAVAIVVGIVVPMKSDNEGPKDDYDEAIELK